MFCVGVDFSEVGGGGGDLYWMVVVWVWEMMVLLCVIVELLLLVVGVINGYVWVGGFGLVGVCDMVVVGLESMFVLIEVWIGVVLVIILLMLLFKFLLCVVVCYYLIGEKFGVCEVVDIGLIIMVVDDVDVVVVVLVVDVGCGLL